jgi:hypothetical protein
VFTLYYWDLASSLRRDGSLTIDGARTTSLEPLYPMLLAAVRWLTGDRPLLVQGTQALVASIAAIYLYKLVFALSARRSVAMAAGALFAVYPLLVSHAADGTESALITLLLIAFAYQFVTITGTLGAAAAGVTLGLAVLTRIVALPLVVIAPALAARHGARATLALAGAALLVLAPYAIRNYALNGAIVPSRGGLNLFIANNQYSAGVIPAYGPDILVPYAGSRLAAEGLANLPATPRGERQEDIAYRRLAVSEVIARPIDIFRLKITNFFLFFSPVLVPRFETTPATTIHLGESGRSAVTHTAARHRVIDVVYTVSYSAVLAFAGAGAYLRRRRLRTDAILWALLLTFAVVHAIYFPATRYRAPVEFVLLFYAAVGISAIETRPHPWPLRHLIGRG